MRVLFAISMLAFAVLLWATVAIVQHVRRSRRRRRRVRESAVPAPVIAPGTLGLTQRRTAAPEQVVQFVDPDAEPVVTFVDAQQPAAPAVRKAPAAIAFAAPAAVAAATSAPAPAAGPVSPAVQAPEPEVAQAPAAVAADPVPALALIAAPVAAVAQDPAPAIAQAPVPAEAESPVLAETQAPVLAEAQAPVAALAPLSAVAASPAPRFAQASAPAPAQIRPGAAFFRARPQVVAPPPVPRPPGPRVAGIGAPWPEVRPLAPHPPLAFPDGVRTPASPGQAEPAPPPPRPVRAAAPMTAAEPETEVEPEAAAVGHFSRMPGWPLPDSAFPQSSDPVAMPLAGRSASGKRPVVAISNRADLEYYKEEMGDLSDPEPPRRISRELKAVKDFSK